MNFWYLNTYYVHAFSYAYYIVYMRYLKRVRFKIISHRHNNVLRI